MREVTWGGNRRMKGGSLERTAEDEENVGRIYKEGMIRGE